MADTMIRGMAANKQVRFFACNSTDTVEKARITHHTSPVVTNALGRLLTGGVLMGAMCKNDTDKLTLRIQCQGDMDKYVTPFIAPSKKKILKTRESSKIPSAASYAVTASS